MMQNQRVMIIVTVPPEGVSAVLEAIGNAGGGEIGTYTHCSFTVQGEGHFKPEAGSEPYSGLKGQINHEPEIRIETFCQRDQARDIATAIRKAHPYEQAVIHLLPLLDEEEL
jgi:hypothetical protein